MGEPSNTTIDLINYGFGGVGGVIGALLVAPNVGLTASEDNVWLAGLVAGVLVIPLQSFWNKKLGVKSTPKTNNVQVNPQYDMQPSDMASEQQLAEHEAIGLTLFSSAVIGGYVMYASGASMYQSAIVGMSSAFTSLGPAYYNGYL